MNIESLYIYPIKSLPAIKLDRVIYDKDGFKFDRIFAIFDTEGIMQTRRTCMGMADFVLNLNAGILNLYSKLLNNSMEISFKQFIAPTLNLMIWDRLERGIEAPKSINEFLSMHFNKPVQLYFIKKEINEFSSFHDDSPILLCNTATINFLESETDKKIDIMRFRPNIILSSGIAFDESNWKAIEINGAAFNRVKLCSRCIVINQDPQTAIRDLNLLKLLEPYSKTQFKIKFGLYLRPIGIGEISLSDKFTIIL